MDLQKDFWPLGVLVERFFVVFFELGLERERDSENMWFSLS